MWSVWTTGSTRSLTKKGETEKRGDRVTYYLCFTWIERILQKNLVYSCIKQNTVRLSVSLTETYLSL